MLLVKKYGISNPKSVDVEYIDKRTGSANRVSTYKNPKSFYVKPTATELKKIKEQYNINILKKTDKGPGKIAFDKRNKRAKQLLKTKKYTKVQANEILKSEFQEIKNTGIFLPGHGGMLDRIDSYIFTPSVIYYMIIILKYFN